MIAISNCITGLPSSLPHFPVLSDISAANTMATNFSELLLISFV